MIYVLKCRSRGNSGHSDNHFTRSFFAESERALKREQAIKLLYQITGGDFLEDSIEIKKLPGFDPDEVRSQGATLFIL